jgi:hypothetical protein
MADTDPNIGTAGTHVLGVIEPSGDGGGEDEALILKYLSGFATKDKKGRPAVGYLKPGSKEEAKARTALASLLRQIDPISGTDEYRAISIEIRCALAALFLPDSGLSEARIWSTREIAFRFRKRGNRVNLQQYVDVANFVAELEQKGWPREAAVESAMKKFGLSRASVFDKLRILD